MPSRWRSGVLLAGGSSVRFGGQPKGLAPFGEARLADRPLAALRAVCDEVSVAANHADAERWFPGIRVVRDTTAGRGGLGALETALCAAQHDTVLVCAWDMPFVTTELLDMLATIVDAGATCCVPVHPDGTSEPLCAAYDRAVCAPAATSLLQGGERAAHALFHHAAGTVWNVDAHLSAGDAARIFSNINTQDELQAAREERAS